MLLVRIRMTAGEPLPLTPFSGTDGGSANESRVPVSVQYLAEAGDVDCDWVTLYDGDGAAFLLFTTDSPVRSFTVLTLKLKDFTEIGAAIFYATPVVLEEADPDESEFVLGAGW